MRTSTIPALLAVAGTVSAAASPGYLKLGFEKRVVQFDEEGLVRRQTNGFVDALLTQNTNKLEYLINITVGTPPQNLAVTLDTGSSDLWIPAVSSKPCESGKCDDGAFDPSKSSTYQVVSQGGFNITYAGPGDSDAGDWATDTITVGGGPQMSAVQIGVALDGFDPHGVMGIGYDTNEASNPAGTYPSTMDQMVLQGIIQRKAFSLYLNEWSANTGSIIFGGIDTTKYTGDLIGLPLQPGPGGLQSEYYVTLTSVTFTDDAGKTSQLSPDGYAQAALLDSGTSSTLLTNDIYQQLVAGFGAVDVGNGNLAVPCDFTKSNATINYSFGGQGGPTVKVPVSQLIGSEYFDSTGFSDQSGGCDFGVGPPIDGVSILGDTFLRSAYAVFDIDNNMAALAQAKIDEADVSSIIAIPSGTGFPHVTFTATATGTQLTGVAATSDFAAPTASAAGTTVLAGTATYNLGVAGASGTSSGTSSTSGAAVALAPKQAMLVGAGLAVAAWAY